MTLLRLAAIDGKLLKGQRLPPGVDHGLPAELLVDAGDHHGEGAGGHAPVRLVWLDGMPADLMALHQIAETEAAFIRSPHHGAGGRRSARARSDAGRCCVRAASSRAS